MARHKPGQVDLDLSPAEAADYLIRIAEALRREGVPIDGGELKLTEPVRIEGGLKSRRGRTTLKLKLKFTEIAPREMVVDAGAGPSAETGPSAPEEATPVPVTSFKKLKKKMGGEFKTLKGRLTRGEPIDLAKVEAFFADCRTMTGYPGNGDEFFGAFNAEVERMRAAAQAGDAAALGESLAALDRLKKACHAKYK